MINGTVSPWNTFGFGTPAAPPPVASAPAAPTSQSTTSSAQDFDPRVITNLANEDLVRQFQDYSVKLDAFYNRYNVYNARKHKWLPKTMMTAIRHVKKASFKIKAKHFPFSDPVCKCTMNGRYQRCINTGSLAGRKCKKGQYNIPHVGDETSKIVLLYFKHNKKIPNTERDLVEHWPYLNAFVK